MKPIELLTIGCLFGSGVALILHGKVLTGLLVLGLAKVFAWSSTL